MRTPRRKRNAAEEEGDGGRKRKGKGKGEAGSGGGEGGRKAGVLGWVFRFLAGTHTEERDGDGDENVRGGREDGTGHLMTRSLRRLFRPSSPPVH